MDPSKIAILMSVRNEESYIDLNISYHLDLGFDYIFIADHCSTDKTRELLDSYKDDPRVIIIQETNPVFDHARIANNLLNHAKLNYKIDWFTFLDADEFLSIKETDVHDFVNRLERNNIPYATIDWANALFDYTFKDYTCSPTNPIDTTKYFYPWPEKVWQEYGHFRKAIVKSHENMEIVVGGHYVRTENNLDFFGSYNWNPFIIPENEAKLLHFEFRGKADEIYEKWKKLAEFENDSTSSTNAPWLERIETIRGYVKEFKDNIDNIYKYSDLVVGNIKDDAIIRLVYELSDNHKSYIQGYMESVGFGDTTIKDVPILNDNWDRIIDEKYILITPHTSWWEEKKRSWGYEKFTQLKTLLEDEFKIKCILLEKSHSFSEMISLIRHCEFIVGNDSTPCVIAQSFDKKSFIIFGATNPKYLHLSKNVVSIYDKDRHKLCSHVTREEEMRCCEEFCMDRIRVSDVLDKIKINI